MSTTTGPGVLIGLLDDGLHLARAARARRPVAPKASASFTKSGWTSRSTCEYLPP